MEHIYNRLRIDYDTEETVRYDFLCRDRLGREIGAKVQTYRADCAAAHTCTGDGETFWGYLTTLEPGRYFALYVQATRNGVSYGPMQSPQFFATAEERGVAIEKYLKGAQKRAVKKAAVVHGEGIQIRM